MDLQPLEAQAGSPLYRQLYEQIAEQIRSGQLRQGSKLPATRELAGLLGLNRTTVAAAYEILEKEGLISGQVGRGSFVTRPGFQSTSGVEWRSLLERTGAAVPAADIPDEPGVIRFLTSRPSDELFPLDEFRATCSSVLGRNDLARILQLGSASGYEPLRSHLIDQARQQGLATPGDDLIVTNGCQQALDLLGRVLLRPGDAVAVEDPTYPGLKNLLIGMGVHLVGIPVGLHGLDPELLAHALERQPVRFLVVTPNFQNPTGISLSLENRRLILEIASRAGVPVIENDAYGDLRYLGRPLPALKEIDNRGGTVLLRSFSKVSFPGLRVGWALGPKPLIERLRQAKEACDLHTDQLSQAVLLDFAESGRLEAHRARVIEAGAQRLAATLTGCREFLPYAHSTEPEGGMNVWVRLPAPLDSTELLPRARREGVAFLPGRYFEVARREPAALRLSFAGLRPEQIRKGLEILGGVVRHAMESTSYDRGPIPALV
jgi:DNA-binding transcriptional MocR family regulator